ncbi:MAG: M3 family oligoendopeptidase [Chlorobi bacterium]|nr:M3 family oligoendopeptidase [Chlorobiota bacterium]
MSGNLNPGKARLKRRFLPDTFSVTDLDSLRPYFTQLLDRQITTLEDAHRWLDDRSELSFVLEEEMAWRYIRMNCHTDNNEYSESFRYFVTELEPQISRWSDQLDDKWLGLSLVSRMEAPEEKIVIRQIRNRHDLFREENVEIQAELQVLEQEYGKIASAMTVHVGGKELTLQQAANYLRQNDRDLRREVFDKIAVRRLQDREVLQENFSLLVEKRSRIARNAGFDHYRDYRFRELGRFDYTTEECFAFHDAVAATVVPLVNEINEKRKRKLGVDILRPYDLEVDPLNRPPLHPFSRIEELVDKAITGLSRIDPRFGELLDYMNRNGFLDLESRKNKAPGGFNYPLYEQNIPFIYMNATGNLRDLETMFHEGGHAVHSFLSSHLKWVENKELPAEIAELASMSMELLSMDYWDLWFSDPASLRRAKREQLEGIVRILPWIAAIDRFQHLLYTTPGHSPEERNRIWLEIMDQFGSDIVSWDEYDEYRAFYWQTQLHLFEVPFYYIEYGIAQMGAIGVWRNYRNDPVTALKAYKKALSLGYTHPVPEIYRKAGIRFDFSQPYMQELMEFVKKELNELED